MAILDTTELKQKFNLQDYPVSIVGNGSLATMTIANHNYKTGDYVNITSTTNFNGLKLVTRLSATQLTFSSASATSESGIIKPWDSMIAKLISQVENHIKNFCDLEYGNVASASETLDLPVSGVIQPKRGRLEESDVTSIKLSRENNYTDASKYITLTASDFFVYEDRIELKFDKCYNYLNCKKGVRITYTTQACPEGLKSIAEQMFEFYFRIFNDKSIAENSRSNNGDQVVFSKKLPQYIEDELIKYQRVNIGDPY